MFTPTRLLPRKQRLVQLPKGHAGLDPAVQPPFISPPPPHSHLLPAPSVPTAPVVVKASSVFWLYGLGTFLPADGSSLPSAAALPTPPPPLPGSSVFQVAAPGLKLQHASQEEGKEDGEWE